MIYDACVVVLMHVLNVVCVVAYCTCIIQFIFININVFTTRGVELFVRRECNVVMNSVSLFLS